MADFVQDIQFDLIVPGQKALTHKTALLNLAQQTADFLNISEKIVFKRLMDKEEIASSAIGNGIALPHLKMRRVRVPFTMMMTLDNDINCETPDGQPINMYCLLISPAEDGPINLRRLSRISRLLKNENLRHRLRETNDRDVMQSLLMDPEGWLLAA